jgi:hypothetical protein
MMSEFNPDNYYKTNLIIWLAIIIGMIVLTGITYFIDQTNSFQPVAETLEVKNIFFALILVAALAVLFLKRSFLDFAKIYAKVQILENSEIKSGFFSKLRTNYIIIWAISESIIMLGFVEYILICDYKSFLLYAIIGLYAIGVNFPRKSLFEKHLQLLDEKVGLNS